MRPLDSREPFRTVLFWDRAVDVARSDVRSFYETRRMEHLAFNGYRPTVYVLRSISNMMAIEHLCSLHNLDQRRARAFRMALVRVEGARLEDGRELDQWEPAAVAGVPPEHLHQIADLVSAEEVELFDLAAILDVGEVALTRTFLRRWTDRPYRLPPTSRHLLDLMLVLYAERAASTATPSGTSSSSPATSSPGIGPASGPPGDATATADPISSSAEQSIPESPPPEGT